MVSTDCNEHTAFYQQFVYHVTDVAGGDLG